MPRYRDEPVAVRVYTVCDESKYLIVRNVPSLGCGEELKRLFESYGPIEERFTSCHGKSRRATSSLASGYTDGRLQEAEYFYTRVLPQGGSQKKLVIFYQQKRRCKPMDAEDCEPYTDVFFIKFFQVSNARFSKRKLDESVFLGNRIQVRYAPQFETLSDTKEKLEARRHEVSGRINSTGRSGPPKNRSSNKRGYGNASQGASTDMVYDHVSSNKDYFPSASMNSTVNLVRDKLGKIESSSNSSDSSMASKKPKVDSRRRI